MKQKYFIYVTLIFFLSLFLNISGSWWAGPDKNRLKLIGDKELVEALSEEMVKSREELYSGIQYYDQEQKYEDREIKIFLQNNKTIKVKRTLLDAVRSFLLRSYAPDEQATLKALSNMKPSRLDFNPGFFVYGGLYLYLIAIFLKVLSIAGIVKLVPDISYYFLHPEQMGIIFTAGKIFGAIFTSLTVYLIYRAGCLLYTRRAGLISAFLFSITPAVVAWSHYLNPYTFTFFWLLLSFCICIKLFENELPGYYILAGLSTGLTAGSLSTYGFIIFAVPVIHFMKNYSRGIKRAFFSLLDKRMWLALLFSIIGFLMVNPYWIASFRQVLNEFKKAGEYYRFTPHPFRWFIYLRYTVMSMLGFPLWLVAMCGVLYAFFKRRKEDILLIFLLLPPLIYFASSMTRFMHYGLYIIPFLLLLTGRLLDSWLKKSENRLLWITGIFVIAIITFYTFSYTLAINLAAMRENTRSLAGKWVNENIPEGTGIGMPELPSPWRTPPFRYLDYRMVITYWDTQILAREKPEYFIVSEYQWLRGYGYKNMLSYLREYEEVKKFEYFPDILGLKFKRDKNSPWDWPDFNPQILIFRRRQNEKN